MTRIAFLAATLLFFVVVFQPTIYAEDATTSHDPSQDASAIVNWLINEHRGNVFDAIDIQAVQNEQYGIPEFRMFATEDIQEGETLFYMPIQAMISSNKISIKNGEEETEDEKEDEDQVARECRTVHYMVDEYLKHDSSTSSSQSKYWPYVRYIFEGYGNLWGKTINTWSDEAYDVFFKTLIKTELFPNEQWARQFFFDRDCDSDSVEITEDDSPEEVEIKEKRKELLERAYYYFLAHSRGESIIPILDMIPHRNGNWTNVDAKMFYRRAILIYATRPIQKDEQLFASINECKEFGCDEVADVYMTQHMFAHRGILENYPRRWLFETDPDDDDLDLIMDLDIVYDPDDGAKTVVHWRQPAPDTFQMNWIKAQLRRLQRMNQTLHEKVVELESPYERNAILQYYEGYVEALQAAWSNRKGDSLKVADDTEATERIYDNLLESKESAVFPKENFHVCTTDQLDLDGDSSGRYEIEADSSFYQQIRFSYDANKDDTSLTLANWLQTSSSSRAHYHEAFVHAPASFIKDVRRILYIGGGDNMILHEIMKYKDLELVVGIELDQKVCRLSFKHFGNAPFFDDPRIQWWFGDATKALYALPDEYFGSFDLVLVDLLTFVSDTVKVTNDLTIMEAAALLMKPDGGVIVRQEDFSVRSYEDVAKYVVELEWRDLPFLCELSITFASDSIDFINTEPTDHGIKNFVRPISLSHKRESPEAGPFYAWNKFRETSRQTFDASKPSTEESEAIGSDTIATGVLAVLEAANVPMASESFSAVLSSINEALLQLKLSNLAVTVSELSPNTAIFVFEEGYAIVRVVQQNKYVGIDLSLWDRFRDLNTIGKRLVEVVGGDYQASTASFNVVTGGILGRESAGRSNVLAQLAGGSREGTCEAPASTDMDSIKKEPIAEKEVRVIFEEMLRATLPFGVGSPLAIGVVCGDIEQECAGFEAANTLKSSIDGMETLAIHKCASFDDLATCESKITKHLKEFVTKYKKVDGIIFDTLVPFQTGQVIHKIFNETQNFDNLLEESIVVLSPFTQGESWRRELVDRFRTDMALLEPAYSSNFELAKGDERNSWSLFSSLEDRFFYRLTQGLSKVIEKSSFDSFSVLKVTNGMKNLVPEFVPSIAKTNDSNWDKTDAAKQWKDQHPIGYQSVMKFSSKVPKSPVEVEEVVLYALESEDDAFMKTYDLAGVVDIDEEDPDVYYLRGMDEDDATIAVHRDDIRKFSDVDDARTSQDYKPGDMILYDDIDGESGGMFHNGVITERTGKDEYSLYLLNFHKTVLHNVPSDRLIAVAENPEYTKAPAPLERSVLVTAFENALLDSMEKLESSQFSRESVSIGQGAIEVALWVGGHAVLKWDGASTVEINLFLEEEDDARRNKFVETFREDIPGLVTTMLDEFPRGYGRVVNLKKEMETDPLWLSKYDGSDSSES